MIEQAREVAEKLALEAGKYISDGLTLGIGSASKDDGSPVTEVDLRINAMVLETLRTAFPDHGFVGEEGSEVVEGARYTWVCDPLDGTIPFIHGIPISVFSLALCDEGKPVLAVVNDPFTKRLFVAEKGKGAYVNGERITVSDAETVSYTSVAMGAHPLLAYWTPGLFDGLCYKDANPMLYVSAVSAGMYVACGQFSALVFCHTTPWDGVTTALMVEEAGGRVTDLFGEEQRYDQPLRGMLASNGRVHDDLLQLISETVIVPEEPPGLGWKKRTDS